MSTRDQRALFYDLVGTLPETKVFGFREKYSLVAAPSVIQPAKMAWVSKVRTVHLHVVAAGKRSLQPVASRLSTGGTGCKADNETQMPPIVPLNHYFGLRNQQNKTKVLFHYSMLIY